MFTKCCITPKFALNVALTATLAMYLGGCGHAIRIGNVGWLFVQVRFRAFCRTVARESVATAGNPRENSDLALRGNLCNFALEYCHTAKARPKGA